MSRLMLISGIFLMIAAGLRAAEPWADARLPESARTGMLLWVDASAQNAARKSLGKPQIFAGAAVDIAYDSSGQKRHLEQPKAEHRPLVQQLANGAAFRFDGKDDCLSSLDGRIELKSLTLFVVAAPYSNGGEFRALFAGNEPNKNDYTSGINVDLGPWFSAKWQLLNAEGPGFGGVANLLKQPIDFGSFRRMTLRSQTGADGVQLFVDGKLSASRRRTESIMRLDQITVGARVYSNEARPPFVRGFLDGDIAEVLLFDRVLPDDQNRAVEKYLATKYSNVAAIPPARVGPAGSKPLVTVKNPPPVQMLVPGFTVRQLPVDLPNINNVRYRPDGKLYAVGYNGYVYLLSDSDGDGIEETSRVFWENKGQVQSAIGMALTPANYRHGQGVFLACKGKILLVTDTSGDDVADKTIVVADRWESYPPEMNTHGVDALGVAVDKDGAIYFGLGCKSYVNGYMIGKDGKSKYELNSERGTILKVSPDFKKREIIATGIRFPVGLAFNRAGDLFATDQEGATWLANGNPFDELLHIQPGRHYGFPPRHPKHLPNVVDEPSTFDYGPQHQSTCGLTFNEPVNGGSAFGPESWRGDAFVAGYSRGKLYRTKLIKTSSGYVAQNQLLACLNMLTADVCVSPKGDLVVAAHSGMPDWGSGPTGKGKLYRIAYKEPSTPQPVLTWAAGAREVRVAFSRPLAPNQLTNIARQARIEYGKHVRAADRFETLRPGYAVVMQQMAAPRFELPILSVNVTPDRRTVILTTAPHPEAAHYALTLPGVSAVNGLPQHPQIDLDYDLCGVQAEWRSADGKEIWSGWLPHLDLAICRTLTGDCPEHVPLWRGLNRPGRLTLRTKLDLWQMLQPAVQPGSQLDYQRSPEQVAVLFSSSVKIKVRGPNGAAMPSTEKSALLNAAPKEAEPIPVQVELDTGDAPALEVAFRTRGDQRLRPLALRRFVLPWATMKRSASEVVVREIPELKDGNWTRGKGVFFGSEGQCSKCHRVRGEGGAVGPDLSNLIHRDYASVLRDIRFPSAAINPDHLTYLVELSDGRTFTGVVKQETGKLRIVDTSGNEKIVKRSLVESMTPATVSTMPEGVDKLLGPEKLRDLLTFLLTEPLSPAALEIPGAPPPRRRAEVEAVLNATPASDAPFNKIHILLCTGPKDHGPGEHDYPLWRRRWLKLFDLDPNVVAAEADHWPTVKQFAWADVIVFYSNNPAWNAERAKELDAYLQRGGGAVFIHYAVDGHRHVDELASLIGLAWRGGASRFRHGPLEVVFDADHPISKGLERVKFIDESYWNLTGDIKRIRVLGLGVEDGAARPLFWTREHAKGRVFVSIPGHYNWTFDDPLFRLLLLRGIAWSAHQPTERFRPLIWPGSRLGVE